MISSETQDAVRRFYDVLEGPSTDILDAFTTGREEFIDDDIRWIWMLPPKGVELPGNGTPSALPFGTYQGADSVFDDFLKFHTTIMDELSYSIEHCFPTRDTEVCVVGNYSVHLAAGGPQCHGLFVHLWEFADGRAIRLTAFAEDGVLQRGFGLAADAAVPEIMAAAASWED